MQNVAIYQWGSQLMPENTCKAWEIIRVKVHIDKHNYYPDILNMCSTLKYIQTFQVKKIISFSLEDCMGPQILARKKEDKFLNTCIIITVFVTRNMLARRLRDIW